MTQMDFAFWSAVGGYADTQGPMADIYDTHIRQAVRLEELGWHSYYTIEHQNSAMIGRITAPTVFLTAVAAATSTLRLGAMVWPLPFYHPLRLAQEVAMLDQLSRGRVEFGTGIGVHEHEFIRWGMDYYERAARSEEILELIQMAWTQDEVTYEGKFYRFDEALPKPQPYQDPLPIWVAVHSEDSIRFAAKTGHDVSQNLDVDEVVAEKFELFWKCWEEHNHPGPRPRVFLMRQVHVAETDEKAHAEARQFLTAPEGGAVPAGTGPVAKTRIGWGTHPRGMGKDSERPDDKRRGEVMMRARTDYDFNIDSGLAIVGSPETVIKRLQEGQAMMGYNNFCTNHDIGKMPEAMVANSIELFGKEVIPAFERVGG